MRKKKSDLTKTKEQLWELCKKIIRRKYGNRCYTCGVYCEHPHTGHFISSSICSVALRYDLDNLRPQCFACNIHKSGNWLTYENNLIHDHGQEYVDTLKKRNQETKNMKYDIYWYLSKVHEYQALFDALPELSTPY